MGMILYLVFYSLAINCKTQKKKAIFAFNEYKTNTLALPLFWLIPPPLPKFCTWYPELHFNTDLKGIVWKNKPTNGNTSTYYIIKHACFVQIDDSVEEFSEGNHKDNVWTPTNCPKTPDLDFIEHVDLTITQQYKETIIYDQCQSFREANPNRNSIFLKFLNTIGRNKIEILSTNKIRILYILKYECG